LLWELWFNFTLFNFTLDTNRNLVYCRQAMNLEMEIKSVTRSIVEYLRGRIIVGEFKPGQKLNENQISAQLNISRPPIREAFRILEQEHLIFSIPRKGSYVTEVSIENYLKILQAREITECFIIDLLKARDIRDLPQVTAALIRASNLSIPSGENQEEKLNYIGVMDKYHVKLVESAGNELLNHFYGVIKSNISRYKYMFLFIPGVASRSLHEHQKILDLIKMGAYDEAKECLRTHIYSSFELIRSKILEKGSR